MQTRSAQSIPARTPAPPSGAESLYPHYAYLRQETPVFHHQGTVYLTRHADCVLLLGDKRFVRRPPEGGGNPFAAGGSAPNTFERMLADWLMFMDPPRHGTVRDVFAELFRPRVVAPLAATIEAAAQELLDRMGDRDKQCDLMPAYAYALPVLVICRLLGVPEQEHERFRAWAVQLARLLDAGTRQDMEDGIPLAAEMHAWFSEKAHACRTSATANDGFSALLARAHDSGLTQDEIAWGCAFLIFAGHETVASMIGSSVLTLNQHPRELARLGQDPSLFPAAVEELLRYESPVQKLSRWSSEDILMGEYLVRRGTLVTALVGAANRDPAAFVEPERLDLSRTTNPHIAFGKGIHHCLGASLARLEARIALQALYRTYPLLQAVSHRWSDNSALRSLQHLQVTLC